MSDSNKKPHNEVVAKLLAKKKAHHESLKADVLFEKISLGEKSALSEAITLIESHKKADQKEAQDLLKLALPISGNSIRIGITGVPGAGKSTFIESFGSYLIEQGKKVAVLAIDPSSEKSGGSILGDKTRMVELSTKPQAFIRPSATAGSLGGVARKTRESIILCEAAGFDVILIETVGVGQSEIAVHSMTDFFLLLMLAGAGDELQGIKRGIMEMADTILITKTDGKNVKNANFARTQYKSALHLFPANENNWIPQVETVSSYDNKGIDKAWEVIQKFQNQVVPSGWFEKKRKTQQQYWLKESVKEQLLQEFNETEGIQNEIKKIEQLLSEGKMTSFQASEQIIQYYKKKK
ncbi:MAG: methylmalonyl Co-A mutase-associated GTPase MeaB [Crocinitomicaceae bacterium]